MIIVNNIMLCNFMLFINDFKSILIFLKPNFPINGRATRISHMFISKLNVHNNYIQL